MSTTKVKKAYRIQLTGSQILLLGILGSLSLVISFYLGTVVGKSLRRPVNTVSISQPVESNSPSATAPSQEKLDFFELGESKKSGNPTEVDYPKLDRLKEKTQRLTGTREMLSSTKDRPVEHTQPTRQPKTPASPSVSKEVQRVAAKPVQPQKPETTTTEHRSVPLAIARKAGDYTVQVFSSRRQQNAENVLNKLRGQGYMDAYIHKYVSPTNQVLYRVRVGKMDKNKAESRAFQLRKLNFIDSVQVTKM